MRFEEAYGGWQERRLTQEEAARMLGVCERTACPRESGGFGATWTATRRGAGRAGGQAPGAGVGASCAGR